MSWTQRIKPALRHIRHNKGYSILNVACLSVAFAGCGLVALFVLDEQSYDRHHEDAENIYRVTSRRKAGLVAVSAGGTSSPSESEAMPTSNTPPGVATEIAPALPEIEHAVRLDPGTRVVYGETVRAVEENFTLADPSFFDVFTVEMVEGDPSTALNAPGQIIITETMAEKYFGDSNPVGQTLRTTENVIGSSGAGVTPETFTVTGIMEDPPSTSTLRFDLVASYTPHEQNGYFPWTGFYVTYIRVRSGVDPAELQSRMFEVYRSQSDNKRRSSRIQSFELERLTDIHLHSPWGGETGQRSDVRFTYIFSFAALLLLIMACLSYVNQALAISLGRTKEVGIRKVIGATRFQLMRQYLVESIIFVFLSAGIAWGLMTIALPAFNQISFKTLTLEGLLRTPTVYYACAGLVGLALVAGSYPALFLSRFDPVSVLIRMKRTGRSGAWFRRSLVIVQVAVAVILVLSTTVLHRQMTFIQQTNLGFDKEHLVVVQLETNSRGMAGTLKNEMLESSGVIAATRSSRIPLIEPAYSQSGNDDSGSKNNNKGTLYLYADTDFLATYGLELTTGRNFEADNRATGPRPTASRPTVINETLARSLETEDVLGLELKGVGSVTITGVVKDFHFTSLRQHIQPIQIRYGVRSPSYLTVRIRPENVTATLESLESIFHSVVPDEPFSFFFLDDRIDAQYRTDQRMAKILGLFATLTLILAGLSLISVAAFSTRQRVKEIGIRKVLGATVPTLTWMLMRHIALLVFVALAFAIPVAYLNMDWLLTGYAYRVDLNWTFFASSAGIALILACFVVGLQTVRATRINPVE